MEGGSAALDFFEDVGCLRNSIHAHDREQLSSGALFGDFLALKCETSSENSSGRPRHTEPMSSAVLWRLFAGHSSHSGRDPVHPV